jgi:hypothetical protein
MHHVSCSHGHNAVSTKCTPRNVTSNLCFLHLEGSTGHVVHSGVRCETSMHYFSCSGGPGVVSIKSVLGHITPNLCFCIWWDLRIM